MNTKLESNLSRSSRDMHEELEGLKHQPPRSRALRAAQVLGTADGAIWGIDQLRFLQSRGYEVTGVVPGEGTASSRLRQLDIPVVEYPSDAGWTANTYWLFFKQVYELAQLFRRRRFDVVQHHILISFIHSRIAAWIADVPVRLYMVATPVLIEGAATSLIERLTCWMDTRIIAGCEFSRTKYREIGVGNDHLSLIYYGPDASNFDPAKADRFGIRQFLKENHGVEHTDPVIGRVAYFYPPEPETDFLPRYVWGRAMKDHESLIDAMPAVIRRVPNAKLVLVGTGWGVNGGDYVKALEERARSLGVGDAVIFLGGRTDIPDILSAFDISVQCSLMDGLGGSSESLLMERPVVATRVGGFPDTVKHEQTGLLVDKERPDQLADAISRLLEDREFAARLGKNGRQMMLEQFCLDTTMDSLDSLYQESIVRASTCLGTRRAEPVGHRPWVVAARAVIALPIIALTGYLSGRRSINETLPATICGMPGRLTHNVIQWLRYLPWQDLLRLPFLLVKQIADTTTALSLIVLTTPIWLTILFSAVSSRRQVLSSQTYLGVKNRPFQASQFNSSVPAVFRWLPLLWSVVKQDMSLVGPRLRVSQFEQVDDLCSGTPVEAWRMKPGITGWGQLSMNSTHSQQELDGFDLLYMAHWSLILDAKILLKTVLKRAGT